MTEGVKVLREMHSSNTPQHSNHQVCLNWTIHITLTSSPLFKTKGKELFYHVHAKTIKTAQSSWGITLFLIPPFQRQLSSFMEITPSPKDLPFGSLFFFFLKQKKTSWSFSSTVPLQQVFQLFAQVDKKRTEKQLTQSCLLLSLPHGDIDADGDGDTGGPCRGSHRLDQRHWCLRCRTWLTHRLHLTLQDLCCLQLHNGMLPWKWVWMS